MWEKPVCVRKWDSWESDDDICEGIGHLEGKNTVKKKISPPTNNIPVTLREIQNRTEQNGKSERAPSIVEPSHTRLLFMRSSIENWGSRSTSFRRFLCLPFGISTWWESVSLWTEKVLKVHDMTENQRQVPEKQRISDWKKKKSVNLAVRSWNTGVLFSRKMAWNLLTAKWRWLWSATEECSWWGCRNITNNSPKYEEKKCRWTMCYWGKKKRLKTVKKTQRRYRINRVAKEIQENVGPLGWGSCSHGAGEVPFRPGTPRTITDMVKNCEVRDRHKIFQSKEALRPHSVPERPWQMNSLTIWS